MEIINMTFKEAKETVIVNANLFYNGKPTLISDSVYDSLLKMVMDENPSFDIYKHIKYDNDGLSVKHRIKFREFDKTADIDKISLTHFNDLLSKYYILPKFDGSSTVTYFDDNGNLDMILSRGDDVNGFLNTNKLKNKVPSHIDGCIAMLGEALVTDEDGGRAKANGLVNSKYMQNDVDEVLEIIPFDYYMKDGSHVPNLSVEIKDWDVFQKIQSGDGYVYPKNGKLYPCDGIVMYPRNTNGDGGIVIRKIYYTEKAKTTIKYIHWEPAPESGVIHPVAEFADTLRLDGVDVSGATLYHKKFMDEHQVYVGMEVDVIRANMTVPSIHKFHGEGTLESQLKHNEYMKSLRCSHCGAELAPYNGGNDYICSNDGCIWWTKFISVRILDAYNLDQGDSKYGHKTLWEMLNASSVLEFLKKFVDESMYVEMQTDINKLLAILRIPRLTATKKEGLISTWSHVLDDQLYRASKNDGRTRVEQHFYNLLSEIQWEYFQLMYRRFRGVIERLKSM